MFYCPEMYSVALVYTVLQIIINTKVPQSYVLLLQIEISTKVC